MKGGLEPGGQANQPTGAWRPHHFWQGLDDHFNQIYYIGIMVSVQKMWHDQWSLITAHYICDSEWLAEHLSTGAGQSEIYQAHYGGKKSLWSLTNLRDAWEIERFAITITNLTIIFVESFLALNKLFNKTKVICANSKFIWYEDCTEECYAWWHTYGRTCEYRARILCTEFAIIQFWPYSDIYVQKRTRHICFKMIKKKCGLRQMLVALGVQRFGLS